MAFHIEGAKLRVFRKFANEKRNSSVLKETRFVILEHLLPTTLEMVELLLDVGSEIFSVVAKPYSIDANVLSALKEKKVDIITESYETLETTNILLNLLESAIKKSLKDNKKIVILDVGGYFAKPLQILSDRNKIGEHLSGVVEDTTFGHNRYLKMAKNISVPVYSVARSCLKEIEARFVGRDAVKATDLLLRRLGVSITGKNALVIGYGMIGKNIARTLKAYDIPVSVYDKKDTKNLEAFIDGFNINKKAELLKYSDMIFFATGDPSGALDTDEMLETKTGVFLISVGSKDTEFDLKSLKEQSVESKDYGDNITIYSTNHSRKIAVLKQGTAVNFCLPSIPIEVLDLVFSEIFLCIMKILKDENLVSGKVIKIDERVMQPIAHDWLRFVIS